jgi:tetratricopeptide (TPR) repeat protein
VAGVGAAALIVGLVVSLYLYAQERVALTRAVAAEQVEAHLRQQAEQSATWSKELSRAESLLLRGQFDDAEKIVDQVPPHASLVALYACFAPIHARRAQWDLAITNYTRVVEYAPSDLSSLHALAALALQTDDKENYRHWREAILQRVGTIQPDVAAVFAEDCLMLPSAAADWETIGKLVDASMTASSKEDHRAYSQFVKGLLEYRQGHFAEAQDRLKKATASPNSMDDWNRSVQAQMLLAMTQYRLKEIENARSTLAAGFNLADRNMIKSGNDLHDEWISWLLAHFLMREATELMPEITLSNSTATMDPKPADQASGGKTPPAHP